MRKRIFNHGRHQANAAPGDRLNIKKMEIMPVQEAFKIKFARQERIKELEYHAAGHCVHVGKISPGCRVCFTQDIFAYNLCFGNRCNFNCAYCPTDKSIKDLTKAQVKRMKYGLLSQSAMPGFGPSKISFSGGGETIFYIDYVVEFMELYRRLEKHMSKKPWYYLYTNGVYADNDALLRLRDAGVDEIRFHLGASNFSKQVYGNIKKAVRYFKAISVETPSWPPHRKKLFEMLPIIDGLGVKHLNLGEVEIKTTNYDRIISVLPEAKAYYAFEMHLYDGGLAYDLIEEIIKKNYSFSVLDCNCFAKMMQRGEAKNISQCDIAGMCAEY